MAIASNILDHERYKSCLPADFLFGAASASHQIEGHIRADGKGPNVWDIALADRPGRNGVDACDSYRRWKDDVALLRQYGMNCYRFSISWARVIPEGGRNDPINEPGIKYYSDLIDHLIEQGIEPVITIFHWDHPQALEDRYGSFSSMEIVPDFVHFAQVCFERFGSRVRKWITMNEPHIFTMFAGQTFMSERFDLDKDFTRLAKSLLLCHANTVALYRQTFQAEQKGVIGIALDCDWTEPIDDSLPARNMQQKFLDLVLGLYAEPIYLGHYTQGLHDEYGAELPSFTPEQWALLHHSSDFFALNHYGTSYSTGRRLSKEEAGGPGFAWSFARTEKVYEKDGVQIGVRGENGHPYDVPWGFRKMLNYISTHYTKAQGIPIWITENGMGVAGEAEMSLDRQIDDTVRQVYYAGYVEAMLRAIIEDGVNIGGYMAWSLMDNLEWLEGYTPRFGLTVVDRQNDFKRHPKGSALLLRKVFAHILDAK